MNEEQKREFIRDLIQVMQSRIENAIPKMPENWDGIELRQYVADCFASNVMKMKGTRQRDYTNEVITRNL